MAQIIKRAFKSFNGVDWDKHYFETSADQVTQDSTHRFVTDDEKNRIFTPDKNLSDKGYVALPNGFILQWGISTANNPAVWTAFPKAFSTKCLALQLTEKQGNHGISINAINTYGFEGLSSGLANIYWFALGY